MNENLKTTILKKLELMNDECGRQLLDYMEYLESKYNRSSRERSTFERLAENVEGTLRSSRIGEAAVKGTGGIIDVAGTVARSFAAAGQAVLDELQQTVSEEEQAESEEEESKEHAEAQTQVDEEDTVHPSNGAEKTSA